MKYTHKWLMILLTWMPLVASAQYSGGEGDGHVTRVSVQLDMSGVPVGVRPLYRGGAGDGFDQAVNNATLNGTSIAVLYGGGPGDGFDGFQSSQTLEGELIAVIYGGGNGDGFDFSANSVTLQGEELAIIYGGGAGDGFDVVATNLSLDGLFISGVYGGGSGDGFDRVTTNASLNGAMLMLYGGGDGDGFDRDRANLSLDGQSLAGLYGGGDGDGFDTEIFAGVVPLPLTLLTFEAIPNETFVLLRWVTENEQNTDYFTIEKTRVGIDFTDVGDVSASGFTEVGERRTYELTDEAPWIGTSFYRLKTTDFDGALSLSHLLEVNYAAAEGERTFDLFPNPNTGTHFSLVLHGFQREEACYFEIIGMNGQQISSGQFLAQESTAQRFELSERLAAGSYLIRLRGQDGRASSKILLVGR